MHTLFYLKINPSFHQKNVGKYFIYLQNALVLVMGSKEEDVPAAPVEQTRFVEDMNESELASAVSVYSLY